MHILCTFAKKICAFFVDNSERFTQTKTPPFKTFNCQWKTISLLWKTLTELWKKSVEKRADFAALLNIIKFELYWFYTWSASSFSATNSCSPVRICLVSSFKTLSNRPIISRKLLFALLESKAIHLYTVAR